MRRLPHIAICVFQNTERDLKLLCVKNERGSVPNLAQAGQGIQADVVDLVHEHI